MSAVEIRSSHELLLTHQVTLSFPISHTPVQIEPVHCRWAVRDHRACVWCGERELHFGLRWTVEYSLGLNDKFLTQRRRLCNPTEQPRPWMSWSNAAVPARPDTEFHFPNGPVLSHGAAVKTIDWASLRRSHSLAHRERVRVRALR
jgi:hypothetical protein